MKKSIGILLVFILLLGMATSVYASEDEKKPEMRKEFVKLKYIQARQAHSLLLSYVTKYGRISIQNELNIVTIQDIPEIVDKMLSFLQKIDVKPVDILFTVDLILGSAALEEGKKSDSKFASDPLIKELKRILSYKFYNKIGTSFIRVQDDGSSEQRIGGPDLDLELRLSPHYVREEKEETIQLKRLELRQYSVYIHDGKKRYSTLIQTPLTLKSGERTVVGVSKLDGGDKALILIISGKVIK